jgi:multicomponent Na+:H+ antiporter subunit F
MDELRTGFALLLLLTVLLSLVRIARGPTLADRLVVAQLFGTSGVTILLLLGGDPAHAALRDVALIFALLALVTVVAFVRLAAPRGPGDAA